MTSADPYAALAPFYDLAFGDVSWDLPLYESFARRSDGPVLELATGTGRVALYLAESGYQVVGIDHSPSMLERARARARTLPAGRVEFIQADMRNFDLARRFDLILCPFASFHHLLTTEDQTTCLRAVRRHLAPGGLFVAHLIPALSLDWPDHPTPLHYEWTRTLPETGEAVTHLTAWWGDRATQMRHSVDIFDIQSADGTVRRTLAQTTLRYFSLSEFELLLAAAALRLEHAYGSAELEPYADDSDRMIVVARAREEDEC